MKKKESKLLFFANKKFTFGKSLPSDFDKFSYTKLIKEHGGTVATFLSPTTSHFIIDEWEKTADKCCEQQNFLEEVDYLVSPKEKEKEEIRKSELHFSQVSFLNDEEIQAEKEVEPAPAHKMTLTQLREQQRLEREMEKKEKKERMEREKLERKMEIEREKQQRLEEILREKEEKKKEMMELLKPAFINNNEEIEEEEISFEFGNSNSNSPSEFFLDFSPLDEVFSNALEEEYKEKLNQREEEKRMKELEKEKKKNEKIQKKLEKKEKIRLNIIENAKKGKELGLEIKLLKRNDYEALKQKRIEERERKQQQWIEEQAKRREEWLMNKERKKIEKKEKKQRWIELKDQILIAEENEKGKKLFFGKIDFSDINIQFSANVIRKDFCVEKRKEGMMNIFKSFGSIVETKENWEKGFVFIVYSTEEEAEKAANDLAIYKIRKQLCNEQKKQLAASGNDEICAPLPTFYTRWPKNQQRKIEIPPSLPPVPKQIPIAKRDGKGAIRGSDRGRGSEGGRGRGGSRGGRGGRERGSEGGRGRGGSRGGAEGGRGRGGNRGSRGGRGGSAE